MDYIPAKEAAAKWNTHVRAVQSLAKCGRIPGAKKYGNSWMIPADAEKPADPRRMKSMLKKERARYTFLTAADLPIGRPKNAFSALTVAERALAKADLAYRRGDPKPAIVLYRALPAESASKLSAASLATAAAISARDYALFDEIQLFLTGRAAQTENECDKALLSLPGVLAAVSMSAPNLTPDWLKTCDFSLFPKELRPFLLFLYTMHLRNVGAYAAELAAAQTALALTETDGSFTWIAVYLGVLAAQASFALGEEALTKRYLESALALAMPYGMTGPFADHLGSLGGVLEKALSRRYPAQIKPTVELWKTSYRNWMDFHNTYTRERIATILTPQEYHVAKLLARGETYAGAAKQLSLSAGRVKNIASAVYTKLLISGRRELSSFIL